MIQAGMVFLAPSKDATLKDIQVGVGLNAGVTGIAIRYGNTAGREGYVQSNVGQLKRAYRHLINNLVGFNDGIAEASVDFDGTRYLDGTGELNVQVGSQVANREQSHVIDAMFKLCIAKLLEQAKTGTAPETP